MANKTKRTLAPILASMIVGLLLVGFQNCTVATEFSSATSPNEKGNGTGSEGGGSGGNGTGYEGKPFANPDTARQCPDVNKDKAISRIVVRKSGEVVMVRANCKRLDPAVVLAPATFLRKVFSSSFEVIVFQDHLFVAEVIPGPDPLPPDTPGGLPTETVVAFCSSNSQDSAAHSSVLISKATLVDGAAATGMPYTVRLLTSYSGNVFAVDPAQSKCIQGTNYASPDFPANGNIFNNRLYLNSDTNLPMSIQILPVSSATGTGLGIPVTLTSNFIQSAVNKSGISNPDISCQHKYGSNSGTGTSQGPAMQGTCYATNDIIPLTGVP